MQRLSSDSDLLKENSLRLDSEVSSYLPLRLLITGGGTGGHVYPALSVIEAFEIPLEVLWIGKQGGMEEALLKRADIKYKGIAAGGVRDMPWRIKLVNSIKLVRSVARAWKILRHFSPNVVLATGGYVTFPVGIAAWSQQIPLVIYLPDIVPGLAVRALAPFATKIALTAHQTVNWFGDKEIVTGYPVRSQLVNPKSKKEARQTFELPAEEKVLLVTGGSQGSHTLNEAIGLFLSNFLNSTIVIHVHGKSDKEWLTGLRKALPERLQERYLLYEYLHGTMIDALLAADLVVARAGASVLGEFTTAGLPAILVPLPIAGVNQIDNARWLEAQGAAIILEDDDARTELFPLVQTLLSNSKQLIKMRKAMQSSAHPNAGKAIATMLLSLAHTNSKK